MIESINQYTIANEIRQRSRGLADVFMTSETPYYDDFIHQLFVKNIIIAHRQQNVIGALEILQNDGYQNIYACSESSIDINLNSNLLAKILIASNWSNQPAKQHLKDLSVENWSTENNHDTDTNTNTDVSIATVSKPQPNQDLPLLTESSSHSPQSPEDILVAFEEALKMGHSEQAIKFAKLGTELFPDNARLNRVAKILAPPIIRTSQRPHKQSLEFSRDWLRKNAQQYKGQWVAVYEGILVGNAPTMQALLAEIDPNIDRDNTLITKVL